MTTDARLATFGHLVLKDGFILHALDQLEKQGRKGGELWTALVAEAERRRIFKHPEGKD